jgi:hypothetical protein
VYTLRLTRSLLAQFRVSDDDGRCDAPPTTRLGDWYVMPLQAGRRSLVLCTSSRSGLTIVMPRPDLTDLPEQLGITLVPLLRALAVPEEAIVAELDEMATGRVGPTLDRSLLGTMRAQGARTTAFIAEGGARPVDVTALHRLLLQQRRRATGRSTIGDLTASLFRP